MHEHHPCLQAGSLFWGTFDFESPAFEWGSDYQRPNLPPQDLIVYEMPIRSFTADPSSKVGGGKQGTFAGVAAKVCYIFDCSAGSKGAVHHSSGSAPSPCFVPGTYSTE